ncbi:hypothetical protein NECAME_02263 [Necator americanus]|uniref:Uncharacterized protein n=1 Tax=Necator americanus TaxID=51031 RepID=W2TGZ9_NECAM|nr:hypothetical protein NECAME_02263 [Necator americanus]ETN80864.1 hypothetical protein NECAME_02263 [Necator americanus]
MVRGGGDGDEGGGRGGADAGPRHAHPRLQMETNEVLLLRWLRTGPRLPELACGNPALDYVWGIPTAASRDKYRNIGSFTLHV